MRYVVAYAMLLTITAPVDIWIGTHVGAYLAHQLELVNAAFPR